MGKHQLHRNRRLDSLGHTEYINPNKTQSQAVDFLRSLAILAVLLIHTTTRHLEAVHFDLAAHQFTFFLNQVSRFAVPLFFLISGYVLELNYRPGYLDFLKRRLSRLFLPYLFWSVIYYFLIYTDHHGTSFFSALLTGDSSYQLYFIPSLLLLYLFFPLLRRLNKPIILISLFIIQLTILNLDYHLKFPGLPYPLAVAIFNIFPFLFGIFMSTRQFNTSILSIFVPVLVGAIYKEGYSGYLKSWNIHYFYSNWRPSILIYSLLLFVSIYRSLPNRIALIHSFSRLSFLVFFIHVAVLEFVWKYLGLYIFRYPGFDLFYFSIMVSLSFSLAWLMHKIPHLSRLTG